ncbi:MAG: hypothetical protein Q8O84_00880, partial [Nanoarchaeota archaeon]|nr:hypothetical protein [Nanoarchaeota archaeon]
FFLTTENDFKEVNYKIDYDMCRPSFILINGSLERRKNPEICRRSDSSWIKDSLKKSKFLRFLKIKIDTYNQDESLMNSEELPSRYYVYQKRNKNYEESFLLTEKIILEAKNYSERLGSKFLLVISANLIQVSKRKQQEVLQKFPELKNEGWDFENPDKLIERFCENNRVDCLYLLPSFKEYANKTNISLHFYKDEHFNELGNRVFADKLYDYIIEKPYFNLFKYADT